MPDSNENQVVPVPTLPLAKAEGALLALAAGDALGWPHEMPRNSPINPENKGPHVEFEGWTRRSGGRFRPFEESIRPGEYSDDTQLTLAVARSRTNYGSAWWKALTKIELPLWTLYERGGGGGHETGRPCVGQGSSTLEIEEERRDPQLLCSRRQRGGHAGAAARALSRRRRKRVHPHARRDS